VDSQFITDGMKFLSGSLSALSCMMKLAVSHMNIMTKCDLVNYEDEMPEEILNLDSDFVFRKTNFKPVDANSTAKKKKFNQLALNIYDKLEEEGLVK